MSLYKWYAENLLFIEAGESNKTRNELEKQIIPCIDWKVVEINKYRLHAGHSATSQARPRTQEPRR